MSWLSARWRAFARFTPTRHELRELTIYAALLPFTWLPRAAGDWAMHRIASFQMREGRRYRREIEAAIPPPMLDALSPSVTGALTAAEAALLADHFSRLLDLAAPWRRPTIELLGIEHLTPALEETHGAILWPHMCSGSSVYVKRALAEHGYPLVHLSRPGHPFSPRPFGQWFINPLLRRPEMRVLKERVEIPDGGMTGALRHLLRALARNDVVSITVIPTATRLMETPCLGGVLRLPAGPVELAFASGAPLLPVFTFGAPWRPVVIIGEPLPIAGRDAISVASTHRAAAASLEQLALQHPAAWWAWRRDGWRPAPAAPPGV